MKHLRYLLMAALVAMALTACSFNPGPAQYVQPVDQYTKICFVNVASWDYDCNYYSRQWLSHYRGQFYYSHWSGAHWFYHNNWYGYGGERLVRPKPKIDVSGQVVNRKGYTRGAQYKETPEARRAQPRSEATPTTPQRREVRQRPSQTPSRRPAVRSRPPPTSTVPPARTAKRRGGG